MIALTFNKNVQDCLAPTQTFRDCSESAFIGPFGDRCDVFFPEVRRSFRGVVMFCDAERSLSRPVIFFVVKCCSPDPFFCVLGASSDFSEV